jgi:hypothetical protein
MPSPKPFRKPAPLAAADLVSDELVFLFGRDAFTRRLHAVRIATKSAMNTDFRVQGRALESVPNEGIVPNVAQFRIFHFGN